MAATVLDSVEERQEWAGAPVWVAEEEVAVAAAAGRVEVVEVVEAAAAAAAAAAAFGAASRG